jgi:hypothetical protein
LSTPSDFNLCYKDLLKRLGNVEAGGTGVLIKMAGIRPASIPADSLVPGLTLKGHKSQASTFHTGTGSAVSCFAALKQWSNQTPYYFIMELTNSMDESYHYFGHIFLGKCY